MTGTATAIYPQTITNGLAQILPATASGLVTLYTGGTNGSRVRDIIATVTDNGTYTLQISITSGATTYLIGSVQITGSSGFTSAQPSVAVLNLTNFPGIARDANGNPYLSLAAGNVLKLNLTTTMNTGKVLSVYCDAEDF